MLSKTVTLSFPKLEVHFPIQKRNPPFRGPPRGSEEAATPVPLYD